jgi:acetylornithine/succinyldiaminopimelate/putrescine aminotransferase
VEYCKTFIATFSRSFETCWINSGAEAEDALKLARRLLRSQFDFLPQCLWQHNGLCLVLMIWRTQTGFSSADSRCWFITFNSNEADIAKTATKTLGSFWKPLRGGAEVYRTTQWFSKKVRKRCTSRRLMILDEIQPGFGGTRLFKITMSFGYCGYKMVRNGWRVRLGYHGINSNDGFTVIIQNTGHIFTFDWTPCHCVETPLCRNMKPI